MAIRGYPGLLIIISVESREQKGEKKIKVLMLMFMEVRRGSIVYFFFEKKKKRIVLLLNFVIRQLYVHMRQWISDLILLYGQ